MFKKISISLLLSFNFFTGDACSQIAFPNVGFSIEQTKLNGFLNVISQDTLIECYVLFEFVIDTNFRVYEDSYSIPIRQLPMLDTSNCFELMFPQFTFAKFQSRIQYYISEVFIEKNFSKHSLDTNDINYQRSREFFLSQVYEKPFVGSLLTRHLERNFFDKFDYTIFKKKNFHDTFYLILKMKFNSAILLDDSQSEDDKLYLFPFSRLRNIEIVTEFNLECFEKTNYSIDDVVQMYLNYNIQK